MRLSKTVGIPLDNTLRAKAGGRRAGLCLMAICLATPALAQDRAPRSQAIGKTTFVPLTRNGNAVLMEPAQLGPNARIVVISTHNRNVNNFSSSGGGGGDYLGRGYRVMRINDYGAEIPFEIMMPAIGAAIKYARAIPGVTKVVLAGQSGGGPVVSAYQEIAEKGPAACQQPARLYPCDGKGLTGLPKADALLLLEANIGAPERMTSVDPAVNPLHPKMRDPALDMYAPQNGFDPKTNTATYSQAFLDRYWPAMRARMKGIVADAQARLKAVEDRTGDYNDDAPFVVPGMTGESIGARLNLADPNLLSQTHGAHPLLKADGTAPVQIIHLARPTQAIPEKVRDTMDKTVFFNTVRQFLSTQAIRIGADFELTKDDMKGVDWRSSSNSSPGNVENISVPTLVMAGNCMAIPGTGAIHMVPLEIVYDHSIAKDKEFVVVDGADHGFAPCRPESGDTHKREMDYVEAWLNKRF